MQTAQSYSVYALCTYTLIQLIWDGWVAGASVVFVAENSIVGKKGRETIKSHCTQYSLSNMDIL